MEATTAKIRVNGSDLVHEVTRPQRPLVPVHASERRQHLPYSREQVMDEVLEGVSPVREDRREGGCRRVFQPSSS